MKSARTLGDEGLGAVEDVTITLPEGRGPHRRRIGSRTRLGEPHAADPLTGGKLGYIVLLLLVRPEGEDVVRTQVGVRPPREQAAAVHTGMPEGLPGQAAGDDVRPRSAQLFGERQAEDAERGEPVPYLEAEFTPEIGLLAQRRHLVAPIAIDRLPEELLFLCEREIHRTPSPSRVRFAAGTESFITTFSQFYYYQ